MEFLKSFLPQCMDTKDYLRYELNTSQIFTEYFAVLMKED